VAVGNRWTGGSGAGSQFALARVNPGSQTPAPALDPVSDTGASSADGITADDTPTFRLTGPPGSYFRLFRGGALVSGAYHAGTTITLPAQAQGTHDYTAVAVDAAGNSTGESAAATVSIDRAAPAAAVTPVSPDPRTASVSSIAIHLSEAVRGFGLGDLRLTRDGGSSNLLTSAQSLTTPDGKAFTLSGLSAVTAAAGEYVLTMVAAGSGVADVAGNALAADATEAWQNEGGGTTVALRAAADAYVRDGAYAAQNFGGATALLVKRSRNLGNSRETYLRFGLAGVGDVTGGTLRLFGRSNASTESVGVALHAVSNTGWSETGLTWNGKPASGTSPLAGTTVAGTTGRWYEFDVGTYLQQQRAAGATAVAFALKPTATTDAQASFASDENAVDRPQLVVHHRAAVSQAIVLSTQSLSVPEGGSASFTVRLAARPDTDVTVGVARQSGDADLTGGGAFAFDAGNWDTPRTVTISAAADADAANGSAVFAASAAGLEAKLVTATEADDDAATPATLRAAADAYVRDGTYAAQNFGAAGELVVKRSVNVGNTRETYLRFDIGGFAGVDAATLRLFGYSNSSTQNVGVALYTAQNTTWSENGLTWDNRPATAATALRSTTVAGKAAVWYEFDVGDHVRQQRATGATAVTFVLKATGATDAQALFSSDETAATRPQLVVAPAASVPQALVLSTPTVNVTEGGTAQFTVALAAAPAGPVTVTTARHSGDGDLTVATGGSLVFTAANWSVPQAVTIAAAHDADALHGSATFAVSAPALATKTVTATEVDDEAPAAVTLAPAADAYVRDGSYASVNFGAAAQLQVKNVGTSYNRETYLRFDLSRVTAVASATLRLYGKLDNTTAPSVAFQVYSSGNTTWGESTLTWANRPAAGGTSWASGTVVGTTAKWYQADLTTLLQQEKAAGATAVTLVIKTSATTNATVLFDSDEGTNGPELIVT
jgi:hypothetical protein